MAKGKPKKSVKKGKRPHKNKPTSRKYSKYKVEGDKITRAKTCPRCGPGVFLHVAANRLFCGKCSYTEFVKQEAKDSSEKKQ